jgi:hypothetical protein
MLQIFTCLCVVLADTTIFVARDNVFVEKAPGGHRSFALLTGDLETEFINLICQIFPVSDIVDHYCSEKPHSLFRHSQQLRSVFAKLDSFYGSIMRPSFDVLTRLCVPQPNSVVCRPCSNNSAVWRDIDRPNSTLVATVCS